MTNPTQEDIQAFLNNSTYTLYEEDVKRNPTNFRNWWRYIEAVRSEPSEKRDEIFERSLKCIPGSYKIWNTYLQDLMARVKYKCINDPLFNTINDVFERSLVFMNKMPKIWKQYLDFLMIQKKITKTRRTFDRALQSLPITQHNLIWKQYIQFARDCGVWETTMRIYRRYILIEPSFREEYVNYLLSIEQYDEAAVQMIKCCNDPAFVSASKHTPYQLWVELAEILTKHTNDIKSIDIEPILRTGIKKFDQNSGKLWCYLATYFIMIGNFDRARDVYEEGLQTVMTVRDFSTIFDSYMEFEYQILNTSEQDEEEEELMDDAGEFLELKELTEENPKFELMERRLETLLDNQKILISNVRLKQNPNDVSLWLARAEIYKSKGENAINQVLATYKQAVETIDPQLAIGKLSDVWVAFAKFYESHDRLEDAISVYQTAMNKASFKTVEQLATIYCECIEMYLRHDYYEEALKVAQMGVTKRSLTISSSARGTTGGVKGPSVQDQLHRNLQLWNLYVDLEESLGTVETTRSVYEKMINYKLATAQNILNYAAFLQEHKLFEESFRVYEKGVSIFPFPNNQEIFKQYLTSFIAQYKGKRIERTREIFEQCLEATPADHVRDIYIEYSKFEEQYGSTKHMMSVLDRGLNVLPSHQKYEYLLYYIHKAEEYYGVTKSRELYERGLEILDNENVKDLGMKFIDMEIKLGEVDRARGIYIYVSQVCNPKTVLSFWNSWREFETKYGNQDTITEMFRIKRSVSTKYDQINVLPTEFLENEEEMQTTAVEGFVASKGSTDKPRNINNAIEELESKAEKRVDERNEEIDEVSKRIKQDPSSLDRYDNN